MKKVIQIAISLFFFCSLYAQSQTLTISPSGKNTTGSIIATISNAYSWQLEEKTTGQWKSVGGGSYSGTVNLTRPNGTYYYRLYNCFPDGSCSYSSTYPVWVELPNVPTINGSFNLSEINEGGSAAFTWSSTYTTSCSATGISGVSATSGYVIYNAPANVSSDQIAAVTLTCSGPDGTVGTYSYLTIRAVNTAPSISNISNRSINQNSNTGDIPFTIIDPDSSSFMLMSSSSNQSLVPEANISVGGSGYNRTVRVTPVAGQYGSTTITLTVSDGTSWVHPDGALTGTYSFIVTVAPLPPTVAGSFNASQINEAGSAVYTWSSTYASSCSATGISGVSATSGSITYTAPTEVLSNQTLSVVLTCTGVGGTNSLTRNLIIRAVNDAPTISNITNRSISQNSNTGNIAFSIADPDNSSFTVSGSSNNQTLVPNANVTFGGSGNNRTVKVTPVTGKYGSATITVTVSDGALTATDAFVVTVTPLAPTASASFSTSPIDEAGSSVYTWSSANTTSCSATGISGVSATSGSITYTAPAQVLSQQTLSVVLTCTGPGGTTSPLTRNLIIRAVTKITNYTYDGLGRLTFVNDSVNGNRDYDYDKAGNRVLVTTGVATDAASEPAPISAPTNLVKSHIADCAWRATWSVVSGAASYLVIDTNGVSQSVATTTAYVNCPTGNPNGNSPKSVQACDAYNACSSKANF